MYSPHNKPNSNDNFKSVSLRVITAAAIWVQSFWLRIRFRFLPWLMAITLTGITIVYIAITGEFQLTAAVTVFPNRAIFTDHRFLAEN